MINADKEKHYKYVFIVLSYKNTEVLLNFLTTLSLEDTKIIIVNSYYDEYTNSECARIAELYNADFISIPNKGYGYGNNIGYQHAKVHYKFDYLIISNSDIKVLNLEALNHLNDAIAVYAPRVITPTGKEQNPNIVVNNSLFYNCYKYGYKYNSNVLLLMARINSRLQREIVKFFINIFHIKKLKIFAPHGCFIILTSSAVNELPVLFNDKMFLYNEEYFFAFNCRKHNVPIYYVPTLAVYHFCGASSNSDMLIKYNKQSFNELDIWKKDNI